MRALREVRRFFGNPCFFLSDGKPMLAYSPSARKYVRTEPCNARSPLSVPPNRVLPFLSCLFFCSIFGFFEVVPPFVIRGSFLQSSPFFCSSFCHPSAIAPVLYVLLFLQASFSPPPRTSRCCYSGFEHLQFDPMSFLLPIRSHSLGISNF